MQPSHNHVAASPLAFQCNLEMWLAKPRVFATYLLIIAISLTLFQQVSYTFVIEARKNNLFISFSWWPFLNEATHITFQTHHQNLTRKSMISCHHLNLISGIWIPIGQPFWFYFFDLNSECPTKLVNDYFQGRCYIAGTDFRASSESQLGDKCVCWQNFKGDNCSIPDQIWNAYAESDHNTNIQNISQTYDWVSSNLKRRSGKPRRLIHALPVNLEIELFEVRIASLYDVVDVFVIGESNFTNSGGSRDLIFLELLQGGWLKPYHDKIVHLFRGYPPPTGFEDGVKADAFMRSQLTAKGLAAMVNLQEDDLWLYSDGDELPRPEMLHFFKLHDGWPQPVAFHYKWAIFGFFWQVDEKVLGSYSRPITSLVTIKTLSQVYQNDSSLIRNLKSKSQDHSLLDLLSVPNAGWHCSWCFSPEGIRAKLIDAPHSDFPRYGNEKAKTGTAYIKRLIKHGIFFNLVRLRKEGDEINAVNDPDFAPPFMQRNAPKYLSLLKNPYRHINLPRAHVLRRWRSYLLWYLGKFQIHL